jgi:hypothetical protein
MVLSQRRSTRDRWMFKLFPFLYERCPHGNIGRKQKMSACYCMAHSSNGSKWSFAIALKINNKWIAVQEIKDCEDCGDHFPVHRLMNKVCSECYKPARTIQVSEENDQ